MRTSRPTVHWMLAGALLASAASCSNTPLPENQATDQGDDVAQLEGAESLSPNDAKSVADAEKDSIPFRRFRRVVPIMECVEALPNGAFRAHFGYNDLKPSSVTIPIGFSNRFFPAPINRGQPTTFLPGLHSNVFQVNFSSSLLLWVLDGNFTFATKNSKRCVIVPPPKCPTSCDDQNPCTADLCDASTSFKCVHKPLANGTSCADGNVCNGAETCQSGVCTAGTPVVCNDNNPCTTDSCDPNKGCVFTTQPDGTSCPVNGSCGPGKCSAGACVGTTCEDNNPCTTDSCGPNGSCTHTPTPAGSACGDNNVCNGADACDGQGACKTAPPLSCDDNNPCTIDNCDAITGCAHVPGNDGATCQNAAGATGKCNAGTCEVNVVCNDNNPCTQDIVNADGTCSFPPVTDGTSCSDGNACNGVEACKAGVCQPGTPVVCPAPDQCHVQGVCDPTSGACTNPPKMDNSPCNDGNACTTVDVCRAGACTGTTPVVCSASDSCHTAGACDPTTGQCSNPPVANGTSCSDGNACNGAETCQNGACTPGMPLTCGSNNPCVAESCDPVAGCVATNVPDGTQCAPATQCGPASTCQAGVCKVTGTGASCDDNNPCTADSCDASGSCVHTPLTGTSCSDGNACNGAETCQAGVCAAGTPVTCTASDQCHEVGTCDPATGACSNPVSTDGKTCSDGNACTTGDVCTAGVCGGTQKTCTASDQCHSAGTCDPATGACSNPVNAGATCNDGDACTINDVCSAAGVCAGAAKCPAPLTCNPDGTCGDPRCSTCETNNTAAGVCFSTIPDGSTTVGCDGFTDAAKKAACQALITCIRTGNGSGKNCGNGDDPTPCLCGTLTAAQCSQANPTTLPGVCRDAYLAAIGTGNIFQDFFATSSPVGIANNLFTCDVDVPCPCGQ